MTRNRKLFSLLALLTLIIACDRSTSPRVPVWQLGPGCTLYFTSTPTDSTPIVDIIAQRFEVCPTIVYDSILVSGT